MIDEVQISIFDIIQEPFKIKNKIRLIELFAGIGSQAKSLERLGVNFEHYKVVEFDKYAISSYNAIHGTNFKTSDVTKIHAADLQIVDTDEFTYVLTYSFPCQDLSVAGKQRGMEKGSGTRSGLLWEVERILNECTEPPQILLMENVTQVHGKKNMDDFEKWIEFLELKGYSNYWQDLNAKDFGIPQNRDRCFMVSILGNFRFEFPKPIKLELRLKDLLEDEVDEKFYISNENTEKILSNFKIEKDSIIGGMQKNQAVKNDGICTTLTAPMGTGGGYAPMTVLPVRLGNVYGEQFGTGYAGNVWDKEAISPTLMTMQGGGRQPHIIVKEATKKGYAEAFEGDSINLQYPNSKTRRGRVGKQVSQTLTTTCEMCIVEKVQELSNISYCLYANYYKGTTVDQFIEKHRRQLVVDDLRIRKLTPLECWRLMGFDDSDYYKAAQINSNTQLYKQAGNSIVVNVLEAIFGQLLERNNLYEK